LVPLGVGESKKYPWGSNSFVLNNLIVLSLAADFSGEQKYAAAVATGMDYLMGRNPMLQCYVTGYGSIPLRHPHHRFWADQLSGRFPPPPPGAVSGGPNSSLQDPQTKRMGLHRGLPPQKCFVDDIEAWSVNEVTINWNAPLTWVAAYLDEWRGDPRVS
jgi:endoglucanase